MAKIVYNKLKSGKLLGGGGPRDKQRALRLKQQQELLSSLKPNMTAEVTKSKNVSNTQQPQQVVDSVQYLPLQEVRKKIDEAVAVTRDQESQRFESGLKNINNQLKDERKKVAKAEEELLNARVEIKWLKSQITETSDVSMSKNIKDLQNKLDRLYNKISDGSIQPLVGSKISRPELEDKIFIDPLEKDKEPKLDSHIEVKEEDPIEEVRDRDMITDLAKLKGLLKLD
jgi:hypothetical protein